MKRNYPFSNTQMHKNNCLCSDATSPFMMVAGYNSLAHDGMIIIPPPPKKVDNVEVDDAFSSNQIMNVHKEIKNNRKK